MTIDEELAYYHATVVLENLPGNAKAFIRKRLDGYTIVVNVALGPDEQREAILHELEHIRRGDLFNTDYVEYAF